MKLYFIVFSLSLWLTETTSRAVTPKYDLHGLSEAQLHNISKSGDQYIRRAAYLELAQIWCKQAADANDKQISSEGANPPPEITTLLKVIENEDTMPVVSAAARALVFVPRNKVQTDTVIKCLLLKAKTTPNDWLKALCVIASRDVCWLRNCKIDTAVFRGMDDLLSKPDIDASILMLILDEAAAMKSEAVSLSTTIRGCASHANQEVQDRARKALSEMAETLGEGARRAYVMDSLRVPD